METFDYIEYKGVQYQSKDTPNQLMDNYKIDPNNMLYVEQYDFIWHEDVNSPNGYRGEKVNHRWSKCGSYEGTINFWRIDENGKRIGYSAFIFDGRIVKLELVF